MGTADVATDADLLVAAAADAAAFEAFYRRYVRRVAGFAAARCAGADDVADAVAQTFVRAMLRLVADGRTPSQAARELGISPGAGWTRLSRARRRIRTQVTTGEEAADA